MHCQLFAVVGIAAQRCEHITAVENYVKWPLSFFSTVGVDDGFDSVHILVGENADRLADERADIVSAADLSDATRCSFESLCNFCYGMWFLHCNHAPDFTGSKKINNTVRSGRNPRQCTGGVGITGDHTRPNGFPQHQVGVTGLEPVTSTV